MSRIVEAALGKDLAERLREFVRSSQTDNMKRSRREIAVQDRLDDFEADLGFLAMLQVATLRLLSDKGILREGELVPRLMEADALDGVEDGALSMTAIRDVIGLPRQKKVAAAPRPPAVAVEPDGKLPPLRRARDRAAENGAGRTSSARAAAKAKAATKAAPKSKAPSSKPKAKGKSKKR